MSSAFPKGGFTRLSTSASDSARPRRVTTHPPPSLELSKARRRGDLPRELPRANRRASYGTGGTKRSAQAFRVECAMKEPMASAARAVRRLRRSPHMPNRPPPLPASRGRASPIRPPYAACALYAPFRVPRSHRARPSAMEIVKIGPHTEVALWGNSNAIWCLKKYQRANLSS